MSILRAGTCICFAPCWIPSTPTQQVLNKPLLSKLMKNQQESSFLGAYAIHWGERKASSYMSIKPQLWQVLNVRWEHVPGQSDSIWGPGSGSGSNMEVGAAFKERQEGVGGVGEGGKGEEYGSATGWDGEEGRNTHPTLIWWAWTMRSLTGSSSRKAAHPIFYQQCCAWCPPTCQGAGT